MEKNKIKEIQTTIRRYQKTIKNTVTKNLDIFGVSTRKFQRPLARGTKFITQSELMRSLENIQIDILGLPSSDRNILRKFQAEFAKRTNEVIK